MTRRFVRSLVLGLVTLCGVVSLAGAADIVFGRIDKINPAQGSFTLEMDAGKIRNFTADQVMLEGLYPGDQVRVILNNGNVTGIRMGAKPYSIPNFGG